MVSEIPKKIYKMLLGLIAFSLSLTSVFATLSTVAIFSSPNNIQAGTMEVISPGTYRIPFMINNTGFYDIENVGVSIELMIYNITNATFHHVLMNQSFNLGNYPAQAKTQNNADFSNTTFVPLPPYVLDPTTLNCTIIFKIDLFYMFRLMQFTAVYSMNITDIGGLSL